MEQLKEIMFIDIETVPEQPSYHLLSETMQHEWTRKSRTIKLANDADADPSMLYSEKSGVYSEFAKIVCIGFGSLYLRDGQWEMRLKSLTSDHENILLNDFNSMLIKFLTHYPNMRFCGHNIKEFDIPFICRRMVINGIKLPECLMLHNKKPWEVTHIDTMELWRFGDHKNFTSLSLLAAILGIPSPKTDLDGSKVASVYWNENDTPRIAKYCLQDVLTSASVYLKLSGINGIDLKPNYVN